MLENKTRKSRILTGKTLRKKRASSDYIVAIPSYKREETLRDKTLQVLKEHKIPAERIHVFVATPEEKERYAATLEAGTYGKLIVAIPGMAAVRNFITEYYPVGQQIVNMDDDIKGFMEFSETAIRNEIPLRNLDKFIREAFAESKKTGFRLWGIYPVPNAFFMRAGPPTTDLKYIIGAFWGIINPGIDVLRVTIDDKEDYLRSLIMYLADGGVLRYRTVAPKTAYYKEKGGMQEERTMNRVTKSAEALHKAFPELTKLNDTKKSGYLELRLRDARPEEEKKFGLEVLSGYTKPVV
jgi:hypothetical protein